MARRTHRLGLVLGTVLVLCGACGPAQTDLVGEIPPARLAECAKKMRVTFPASTRTLGLRDFGREEFLGLKLEMAAADWPEFVATSPVPAENFAEGALELAGDPAPWWQADQTGRVEVGEVFLDGESVFVASEPGSADPKIVYLVWQRAW